MINKSELDQAIKNFKGNKPFDHCIVDNFLGTKVLNNIIEEFPDYNSDVWLDYKNALEDKKTSNTWHNMPEHTYSLFQYLNSPDFTSYLSNIIGEELFADYGLHGGGWHCHSDGGNLNPHMDYSIHPKIKLERFLNIIIYVSRDIEEKHGGHLGLWEHDNKAMQPGELIKEVFPKCNRAILFNTTQNSWHGMSRRLSLPKGIYRSSLAIYYLRKPSKDADSRGKALFAPREDQKNDKVITDLIKLRADTKTASQAYKKDFKK